MGQVSMLGSSLIFEITVFPRLLTSLYVFQILPAITALIDKRLGGLNEGSELQNQNNQFQPLKKAITVKELAIQTSCTSIEKLSLLPPNRNNLLNTSNLTMCDKGTQWSLHNLNEVGTQTKKSATKKKDKDKDNHKKHEKIKSEKEVKENNTNPAHEVQPDDPVLKLLTPG